MREHDAMFGEISEREYLEYFEWLVKELNLALETLSPDAVLERAHELRAELERRVGEDVQRRESSEDDGP